MALKEVLRPLGLIPSFANDLNLDDPGETWDTTPTKVEPGAGKRDDGILPDEDINAQHINHLFNELGKWVQFFSDIQVQNWLEPTTLPLVAAQLNTGNHVCWDDANLEWWTVADGIGAGTIIIAAKSRDGRNWIDEDEAGTTDADLNYCFSKPTQDTPTHTGSFVVATTEGAFIVVNRTGTWTEFALTATDTMNVGVWDPGNELLLAGGDDLGGPNVPIIYSSPSGAIVWTRVVPTPANSTTVVDMATDGAGLTLAIGDGANGDTWTSTNGTSWTLRATTITSMLGCWFNTAQALWMIVTSDRVYTSPDAIVWTLVDGPHATDTFTQRTLRGFGSLWVACGDADAEIVFSTDNGASWRRLVIPQDVPVGEIVTAWRGIAYSPQLRKFMVVADRSAAAGSVNLSLSVGTILNSASEAGDDAPTVT